MFDSEKVEISEKVKFYKKSKGLYVYMVGENSILSMSTIKIPEILVN